MGGVSSSNFSWAAPVPGWLVYNILMAISNSHYITFSHFKTGCRYCLSFPPIAVLWRQQFNLLVSSSYFSGSPFVHKVLPFYQ